MAYNFSKGKRGFGDITFEDDADTGIDFEADTVKIQTDGTDRLVVTNSEVTLSGDVIVDQKIIHNGDADTLIRFDDNQIILKAGNISMVKMEKNSSAPHEVTINDGSNNIDFVVKGNGSNAGNPGMKFDASTNKLGINGVGTPTYELDVAGNIGLNEYIYHNGDDDTYIQFQDNDVRIAAGGSTRLKISGSQGQVTFNEAFTFPHSDGNRDQVLATDGNGAVSWVDPATGGGGGGASDPKVLMVHLSSDWNFTTTTTNEFQTVPFNSVLKSTFGGSDFNTGTYTFTAPEEGFYLINVQMFQKSINTGTAQYQVRISSSCDWAELNGAIAFRGYFPGAMAETTDHTHRLDRIAHLSGSDKVKITFRNIGGAESGTYLHSGKHTTFLTIQKL